MLLSARPSETYGAGASTANNDPSSLLTRTRPARAGLPALRWDRRPPRPRRKGHDRQLRLPGRVERARIASRLIAAAFLTTTEFGLWAVILTIVINMGWLKDLGIPNKYIQQSEPDQEIAFQKAFTLELYASLAFFLLFAAILPLWALAYGQEEIVLAGLITALAVPLQALQMPAYIPYRRLQYGRQRLLTGVTPILSFVITVALAIWGLGYWSFVLGVALGALGGSIVCIATCPYRLRLRFDHQTLKEYASFSWPLVGAGLGRLVLVQGSLLIANATVGLSGVGAIGIVVGVIAFTDRVDTVISQTIYPAVCAVAHRLDTLEEVFVKSNRAALMWAIPFGVGVALFAGDLITFVLGEKWRLAENLLIVTGLSAAIGHLGFNWIIFLRALNWTKPILVGSVLSLVVFLGVALPAMDAYGLAGYATAFAVSTAVQLIARAYYMGRVFPGLGVLRHASRSILPAIRRLPRSPLFVLSSPDRGRCHVPLPN